MAQESDLIAAAKSAAEDLMAGAKSAAEVKTPYPENYPAGASSLQGAMRERLWVECSLDLKIERLRSAIIALLNDAINDRASDIVAGLLHHEHGANGQVLTPAAYAANYNTPPAHPRLRTMRDRLK